MFGYLGEVTYYDNGEVVGGGGFFHRLREIAPITPSGYFDYRLLPQYVHYRHTDVHYDAASWEQTRATIAMDDPRPDWMR